MLHNKTKQFNLSKFVLIIIADFESDRILNLITQSKTVVVGFANGLWLDIIIVAELLLLDLPTRLKPFLHALKTYPFDPLPNTFDLPIFTLNTW